jgi:putative tryptophan/tyrosine transport system substrate-binding protein
MPSKTGLVTDLERPGDNVTGVTSFDPEQPRSQMRFLKETISGLERVAILGDADILGVLMAANERGRGEGRRAAPAAAPAERARPDLDRAFAAIKQAVDDIDTHGRKTD